MRSFGDLLALLLMVPFGLTLAAPADAALAEASFTVLWSFPAPPGGVPSDPALFAPIQSGPLYGTTLSGGTSQRGSVFKLIPPSLPSGAWRKSVLWSFGGQDGAFPHPGFVDVGPRGEVRALYGTTAAGGTRDANVVFNDAPIDRSPEATVASFGAKGAGAVFKLIPPTTSGAGWSETLLYSFAGRDGARPNAGLIHDAAGALYGTTAFGGTHGLGTVFRLTPPTASNPHWIETVLHSFAGPDGGRPSGGLIFDTAGALYGTTIEGGRKDMGTVFRLAPPSGFNANWTETVLHCGFR